MAEIEYIEIDPVSRIILSPKEMLLGVMEDANVERKYFKCPKIVGDNIDLSQHQIYIKYIQATDKTGTKFKEEEPGFWHCEDVSDEGDYITFSWRLTGNVFVEKGFIAFSVVASDGEVVRWGTTTSVGTVLITIPGGLEEVAERYPDIISQLLNRMDEVEAIATPEAMQNYVEAYLAEHPAELDETLTDNTKAAPAWMVGKMKEEISSLSEEIDDLKENGTGTGTGLSAEIKSALMAVVENIGLWKDGNGQIYIDNLRTALYNAPLSSISAVYTQSKTVYVSDNLDVLKDDLVVTGTYTDGSSAIVTDYTLSGTLTVGTSMITVSKNGKTATFEVTVTASRVPATGITLNKTTLSFTSSEAVQLTATVEPSNSTDTIVWRSSEDAVATVENGLVTPVADGSCMIYATAGDFTAECSVSVALPINGMNIGNPLLTKVDDIPSTVALTEEEAQGKWYKALYNTWANNLGVSNLGYAYLHPFTDGTFYIRMLGRTLSDPIKFYAFENADIGMNPTATLGKVGDTYTEATVQQFTSFDWIDYAGNKKSSTVNLGEWKYVDGSGTTYTGAFVKLFKVTVPKDVYVFMATAEMAANKFPGISENYPYMNDLYTIFDSDPSANILQVVE